MNGDERREVDPVTVIDGRQSFKSCFQGDPDKDAEKDISITYTDSSTESHSYSKTQGFSISAGTSGLTGKYFKVIDFNV